MKIKIILFNTISLLSMATFSFGSESSQAISSQDKMAAKKQDKNSIVQSSDDHLTKKDLIDFINDAQKEHSNFIVWLTEKYSKNGTIINEYKQIVDKIFNTLSLTARTISEDNINKIDNWICNWVSRKQSEFEANKELCNKIENETNSLYEKSKTCTITKELLVQECPCTIALAKELIDTFCSELTEFTISLLKEHDNSQNLIAEIIATNNAARKFIKDHPEEILDLAAAGANSIEKFFQSLAKWLHDFNESLQSLKISFDQLLTSLKDSVESMKNYGATHKESINQSLDAFNKRLESSTKWLESVNKSLESFNKKIKK